MGNNEQQVLPNTNSNNNNNNTSGNCNNNNNNNIPIKPTQGRYCHIVKRPDFDGYGFNLHSEKVKPGQYIGKVDANSPAEAAGLREGDQILEVNGVNIGSETHKQVVQRIKAIANEVRLLLVDPNEVSKNQATANEKSKRNSSNSTVNPKVTPNTPPPTATVNAIETIAVGVTTPTPVAVPVPAPVVPDPDDDAVVEEQKEYITSISMISTTTTTKSSQVQSNVDVTDHPIATVVNGHNAKANGNSVESTTIASSESPEPIERPNDNGAPVVPAVAAATPTPVPAAAGNPKAAGLNLNLTAAEMRAKLLAKKKYDPKNESVDLKKKFEIIQKL